MNITIFGATGGIGKCAVEYALKKGYQVTTYARSPERLQIKEPHLKIVKGEISSYETMLGAIEGQDAVIWCVGIPLARKYDKMASLEGHKNLIYAMEASGVKRLVDWGTPSVPFSNDKKSFITVVPGILAGIALTQAKKEMIAIGDLLQSSDLDWTMVRFMAPHDGPYTGNIKVGFGDTKMNFRISRADIAAFMVEQVESKEYINSMPIIGS